MRLIKQLATSLQKYCAKSGTKASSLGSKRNLRTRRSRRAAHARLHIEKTIRNRSRERGRSRRARLAGDTGACRRGLARRRVRATHRAAAQTMGERSSNNKAKSPSREIKKRQLTTNQQKRTHARAAKIAKSCRFTMCDHSHKRHKALSAPTCPLAPLRIACCNIPDASGWGPPWRSAFVTE